MCADVARMTLRGQASSAQAWLQRVTARARRQRSCRSIHNSLHYASRIYIRTSDLPEPAAAVADPCGGTVGCDLEEKEGELARRWIRDASEEGLVHPASAAEERARRARRRVDVDASSRCGRRHVESVDEVLGGA